MSQQSVSPYVWFSSIGASVGLIVVKISFKFSPAVQLMPESRDSLQAPAAIISLFFNPFCFIDLILKTPLHFQGVLNFNSTKYDT